MEDKELQEARNCVKEANLFEENMTAKEIKQTYRAIQLSKKTSEKDEQKRLSDSFNIEADDDSESEKQDLNSLAEELCDPSTLKIQKKEVTGASEQNNNSKNILNGLEKSNLLDATKVKFGYLDMPPMAKYTDEFYPANTSTKSSIYWSEIRKEKAKARQAVQSSNKKKSRSNWILIATSSDECFNETNDNPKETYISRSGRLTKRKSYVEFDEDSNNATITPKKPKINDRGSLGNNNNNDNQNIEGKVTSANKKSKSTPTKDIEEESKSRNVCKKLDYTPVLTPLEEDNNQEEDMLDVEDQDPLEQFVHNETLKANVTVRPKSKKLSNDEIMKRSRLFEGRIVKKRRSEEMLYKSMEEQEKKKKEEKVMEKFEKSIDSTIEDDDEPQSISPKNEVKVVYPRRVIPPVPWKNSGSRAGKIVAAVSTSNQATKSSTSQDPEVSSSSKATTRRRNVAIRDEDAIEVAAPSTSNVDTSDFRDCPICQKSFHIEAIETHASTCGDEDSSSRPATQRTKKMQCEICGERFPVGDRYNLHVTDCLSARQRQDELLSKYDKS